MDYFMNYFIVNPLWVMGAGGLAALWLYLVLWVSADARTVGLEQTFWNTMFYLTGAFCALLTWIIHPVLVVSFAVLLITMLAIYVQIRNQRVPEDERLFGKEHMSNVLAAVLARLGISIARKVPGAVEGGVAPQIVLTKKDGTPLEAAAPRGKGKVRGKAGESIYSCKQLVQEAIDNRATDIHLEPKGDAVQVRYRIDGVLHNVEPLSEELGTSVVSALKVLADMDISEKRRPQDGNFAAVHEGRDIDFRVATSNSLYGETMAIRVLDRAKGLLRLQDLGMSPRILEPVQSLTQSANGMLVSAGPTGSGKTTTLYAILSEIDALRKNVITIEDPIEYKLDNVTQMPINVKAGIKFSNTLRSVLRQDPDVIMVGEIRDLETVQLGIQASLTGHFVLTTVHANNSPTSIFRLIDLGVEPYLIASGLKGVLSQRLVRVLCDKCKVPYKPRAEFLQKLGVSRGQVEVLYKAKGCEHCQGTGYRGRTGVFELLVVNQPISELVRRNVSIQALRDEARKTGMRTLEEDGIRKAIQGITSLKEVARVTK